MVPSRKVLSTSNCKMFLSSSLSERTIDRFALHLHYLALFFISFIKPTILRVGPTKLNTFLSIRLLDIQ